MKKLITLSTALVAVCMTAAKAQTNYDTYKKTLEDQGYTVAYDGYCDLAEGETCKAMHTFYHGNTYKIVAFTNDENVTDIDDYLYESDGDLIDKDADATDLAVINFTPTTTRECKVIWKNYASNKPKIESRCRCLIVYKGASSVTTTTSKKTNYETYKKTLEDQGYTIAEDKYCDLAEGETCKAFHTFYHGNDYKIVAFSDDDEVTDVDVYLYDEDGDQIDKDADATDLAVINFSPSKTGEYKMVWKNYASNTPKTESKVRCFVAYK